MQQEVQQDSREALRSRPDYIDWDTRVVLDETVEYRMGDIVVFTRPRCPVTNSKRSTPSYGKRCSMSVGEGYEQCWNHRAR